jgi:hypothetical protein
LANNQRVKGGIVARRQLGHGWDGQGEERARFGGECNPAKFEKVLDSENIRLTPDIK